jgi:hypothetical protein
MLFSCSLPQAVEAAWQLHSRLQALSERSSAAVLPGLPAGEGSKAPPSVGSMAAVAAQRQRLYSLQRSFVDRASDFLQQQLAHVADAVLQQVEAQGAARLRPAPRASVRQRAAVLTPLLEVVGALRPAATVAPREAYCQAVAALLRRELHGAVGEVRRMALAAEGGGQQEPDLLKAARPASSDPG